MLLYTFIKLNLLNGKTLIFMQDINSGYKLKVFLERFHIRSLVIHPETTKTSRANAIHYFNIGQFDHLIVIQGHYEEESRIKEIMNVVNFEFPSDYNQYKSNADKIEFNNGSVFSLLNEKEYY